MERSSATTTLPRHKEQLAIIYRAYAWSYSPNTDSHTAFMYSNHRTWPPRCPLISQADESQWKKHNRHISGRCQWYCYECYRREKSVMFLSLLLDFQKGQVSFSVTILITSSPFIILPTKWSLSVMWLRKGNVNARCDKCDRFPLYHLHTFIYSWINCPCPLINLCFLFFWFHD